MNTDALKAALAKIEELRAMFESEIQIETDEEYSSWLWHVENHLFEASGAIEIMIRNNNEQE